MLTVIGLAGSTRAVEEPQNSYQFLTPGTTRLSSKGQVIIPQTFRTAHRWEPGQELVVIDVEDGILLKSKTPFAETTLDEVAGSLRVTGKTPSLDDMEAAIRRAVRSAWRDRG